MLMQFLNTHQIHFAKRKKFNISTKMRIGILQCPIYFKILYFIKLRLNLSTKFLRLYTFAKNTGFCIIIILKQTYLFPLLGLEIKSP